MTIEEYNTAKEKLKELHDSELRKLSRHFAFENNTIKENDIIEDHIGKIEVHTIQWTFGHFGKPPHCIYNGIELKKDGTRPKKLKNRTVYPSNIKFNL